MVLGVGYHECLEGEREGAARVQLGWLSKPQPFASRVAGTMAADPESGRYGRNTEFERGGTGAHLPASLLTLWLVLREVQVVPQIFLSQVAEKVTVCPFLFLVAF